MQVAGYQPFKQAFLQVVQMSSLCRQEQMIFGLCLQIIPLALHFTLTRPPRPFHFQLSTVATMSHMEPGRTATSKPDQSRNSDGSVDDTAIYVKFSSVANQSSSGSAPAWISRVQDYMATVPRVVNIPSFVLTAEPKAATTDSEGMMALDLQHLNPNWGTLLFNRDDGPVHAYYPYAGRAETRSAYIFAGTIIPPHSTQPASSKRPSDEYIEKYKNGIKAFGSMLTKARREGPLEEGLKSALAGYRSHMWKEAHLTWDRCVSEILPSNVEDGAWARIDQYAHSGQQRRLWQLWILDEDGDVFEVRDLEKPSKRASGMPDGVGWSW